MKYNILDHLFQSCYVIYSFDDREYYILFNKRKYIMFSLFFKKVKWLLGGLFDFSGFFSPL